MGLSGEAVDAESEGLAVPRQIDLAKESWNFLFFKYIQLSDNGNKGE